MITTTDGCYPQDKIRRCQQAGAKAVLIEVMWGYAGYGYFQYNGKDNRDLYLPSMELEHEDAEMIRKYLNTGNNITASLNSGNFIHSSRI